MSQFLKYKTLIKNVQDLCEVLRQACPNYANNHGFIEVHDTPQNLYGYHGDVRAERAHIIIRRQYVGGASNDIGFLRNEDGSYTSIVSEYDKTHSHLGRFIKNDLPQTYTEFKVSKAMTAMTAMGYDFEEITQDNFQTIDHPLATSMANNNGQRIHIGTPRCGMDVDLTSSFSGGASEAASMGY